MSIKAIEKKLINGDTYRKLSDEKLADILIKDTCSFNNSSHIQGSTLLVLEDLKSKLHMFDNNLNGLYIRKSSSSKTDTWLNVVLQFLKDSFNLTSIKMDRSNHVGQVCKKRLSSHYIFKHIEMVHIIEAPKNPILYGWIGNIAAISKPNKAYTDTGSNGFGRETARKIWQQNQFNYVQDSIMLYNDFIKSRNFKEKIMSWAKKNHVQDIYQQKLLYTFSILPFCQQM